jgi:hypothetical protein
MHLALPPSHARAGHHPGGKVTWRRGQHWSLASIGPVGWPEVWRLACLLVLTALRMGAPGAALVRCRSRQRGATGQANGLRGTFR